MKFFTKKVIEEKISTGRKEQLEDEVRFKTTLIQWDKVAEEGYKEDEGMCNLKDIKKREDQSKLARKEIFEKLNKKIDVNESDSFLKRLQFKKKLNFDKKNNLKRKEIELKNSKELS